MRELEFKLRGSRYLLPVAILKPGAPTDLTTFAATALLDTGATISGIGPRPIEALGLRSFGKNRLRSATDEVFVDYYLFRIGFYTANQLAGVTESLSDLPFVFDEIDGFSWARDGDFDVILGMDILSQCDIALSRSGKCRIAFG